MGIDVNDAIDKFGDPDIVTIVTPGTVVNNAFSAAGDVTVWTNDENAPFAGAELKAQFVTTMPSAGSIPLFARLLNIDGTNDMPAPHATFEADLVEVFQIDFGQSPGTDFYMTIPFLRLPNQKASQDYQWYIKNQGTLQTIGAGWQLRIKPFTTGPKV